MIKNNTYELSVYMHLALKNVNELIENPVFPCPALVVKIKESYKKHLKPLIDEALKKNKFSSIDLKHHYSKKYFEQLEDAVREVLHEALKVLEKEERKNIFDFVNVLKKKLEELKKIIVAFSKS